MDHELDRRLILGAVGLAGVAALAKGGPLNPPAGPVTPTGRTLLEVEPRIPLGPTTTPGDAGTLYRITQPGSYYLTANTLCPPNMSGIQIETGGVTLDLMGFELRGSSTASSSEYGIRTTGQGAVAVRNGTVSNWFIGLAIYDGSNGTVSHMKALNNVFAGLGVGYGSTISDSVAFGGRIGFDASAGSIAQRCSARNCTQYGLFLAQSTASECSAHNCTTAGLFGNYAGAFISCYAYSSTGDGFKGDFGFTFIECVAIANQQHGFNAGTTSTLHRCTSRGNILAGINCGDQSVVKDCTCTGNSQHGIAATSRADIRGNTCDGHSATNGIQVTGSRGRIEANHATNNRIGINIAGTSNLVIRNSVSGNSQFGYAFAAGNSTGPNLTPAGNPIATSSNPHANYEF